MSCSKPTAAKSMAKASPGEGTGAGRRSQSSVDQFSFDEQMQALAKRVSDAKLAANVTANKGREAQEGLGPVATPVRSDRKEGRRPLQEPTFTPIRSPGMKKIKVEVPRPAPKPSSAPCNKSPASVVSSVTSPPPPGSETQLTRQDSLRHSVTATTIPLGGSPSAYMNDVASGDEQDRIWCTGPIEYLFGENPTRIEITPENVGEYKPKLIEWLQTRGYWMGPKETQGLENELVKIYELVKTKGSTDVELQVLTNQYEEKASQIEKAKSKMMEKYGRDVSMQPVPSGEGVSRSQKLNEWVEEKLDLARQPVDEKKAYLIQLEKDLDSLILSTLNLLQGPPEDEPVDPGMDELIQELDKKFGAMDVSSTSGNDLKELNAATVALEHISSLPDGPQKSALLAVLEASSTKPPLQVEPSNTPSQPDMPGPAVQPDLPAATAAALGRRDTTQLEAAGVQALHEKYRDDPDAVFTETGVHFIGPKGPETEDEHNVRILHNARMRFNRSFAAPSCPPAILELWKSRKGSRDKLLTDMFEDYLQSGEDWFSSSLLMSMTKSSSQKKRGRHVMLPYREVKDRFGASIATTILQEKKALEERKPKNDSIVYYMPHPECPKQEEWALLRIWDAMEFEDEEQESVSMSLQGSGDFDAQASKAVLGSVMGPEMGKINNVSFGARGQPGNPGTDGVPGQPDQSQKPGKVPKQKPMSKKLSGNISTCSAKMTEVLSWQSKLDQNTGGLTAQLVSGFKRELDGRLKSIQDARVELERLYGQRIDDGTVDLPENNKFKEECLCAIRAAEASFTSYHGSVRSIKSVIESSKPKAKAKAKAAPHGSPSEVEGKDNQPPPAE